MLAPALSYAEHGFPMYEYMHRLLVFRRRATQFELYPPGGTAVFYPGGRVPAVGDLFRAARAGADAQAAGRGRTQAAAAIARRASRAARERFYRGDIAADDRRLLGRCGRAPAADDLAGYRAGLRGAAQDRPSRGARSSVRRRGRRGPCCLQALGMLRGFDLRAMGHNSSRYIHVVTEALKLAFADRERFYGDSPTRCRWSRLLSPAYLRERAALIRFDRATPEAPAPGDPGAGRQRRRAARAPGRRRRLIGSRADGTTHIAAIDREGNMICLTPSGGVFRKSAFAPSSAARSARGARCSISRTGIRMRSPRASARAPRW